MKFTCETCANLVMVKEEALKQYAGQTISVKCPKCGEKRVLKIALPKANPSVPTKLITEIIPTRKSSTCKITISKNDLTEHQIFRLGNKSVTVGRNPKKRSSEKPDIAILTNDKYMSRIHCFIAAEDLGDNSVQYVLSDLNSANKTYCNGRVLEKGDKIILSEGDIVRIGHTEFTFSWK